MGNEQSKEQWIRENLATNLLSRQKQVAEIYLFIVNTYLHAVDSMNSSLLPELILLEIAVSSSFLYHFLVILNGTVK